MAALISLLSGDDPEYVQRDHWGDMARSDRELGFNRSRRSSNIYFKYRSRTCAPAGLNIWRSRDNGPRKRENYNCGCVNCVKQSMDMHRNDRLVSWKLLCRVRSV